MNLKICENPVRIFNKHTRKFEFVRCGKCSICLNIRQSSLVQRMEEESKCWRYCVFFTLTFDEKSIPHFVLSPDNRFLVDPHTGLTVDMDDLNSSFKTLSPVARRLYVCRRRFIPYVTVKHGQDFIKRLRYYFNSLIKNTHDQKILRYVCVSEYGPSLYRPHIHGVLWFNSRTFAGSVQDLISKAWPFGRVDCSFVKSSASSYVARYVSCTTGLPRVYLHRELRPFIIFSKFPAIGSFLSTSEELREIFVEGSVTRTLEDRKSLSVKDVPLWRSFESRLFPKVKSFADLSHRDRVTLYSVYRQSECEHFEDFLTWCINIVKCHNSEFSPIRTFVSSYLNDLFIENESSVHPERYYSLRNLYYVSRHVYFQRLIFGVSLDYYVGRIENYYSKKELFKLKNFYLFQEEFSKQYGTALPLVYMYDNSKELVDSRHSSLVDFGFDVSGDIFFERDVIYARGLFEVLSFVQFEYNRKIQRDSLKSKKKNDYLDWVSNHSVYKHKLNFDFYKSYA